ncbi:hypothetical protein TRFO_35329 [Tritrichomonas foetus]|uniref:Protein kinase domain-containing protein n=1 Tax=Tritrichomonas foetus TaxID=1144522 RepID=A0A1J4JL33_9EUKA|nr:hypothetical protein TRFO_35329 [Tritrichomonas foetus]|eukprot:OHS98269.1 hypothetical protein TRFO_35329 [Tritrichomonas foetus]
MTLRDYLVDLREEYNLKELLGNGTYGNVHLIERKCDNALFAGKLSKQNCKLAAIQKSLFAEIEILSKADHPAILKFIGFSMFDFDYDPRATIIVEYLPNGTLEAILKNERLGKSPPEWNNTQKYICILGIILGMKYLHNNNISHRDLKPANIMFDENYRPKICDFGTSKYYDSSDVSKLMETFVGSLLYMAPEQIDSGSCGDGLSYNNKIDVYAFSLILYEILSGVKPFIKSSCLYHLSQQIVSGVRPDISLLQNEFQKELVSSCWEKEPENRPSFDQLFEEMLRNGINLMPDINESEVLQYLFETEKLTPEFIEKILKSEEDKDICYQVAKSYYYGWNVNVDKREAFKYFKRAAELNVRNGYYRLCQMLSNGDGVAQNKQEGIEMAKKGAELGSESCKRFYINALEIDADTTDHKLEAREKIEKFKEWFKKNYPKKSKKSKKRHTLRHSPSNPLYHSTKITDSEASDDSYEIEPNQIIQMSRKRSQISTPADIPRPPPKAPAHAPDLIHETQIEPKVESKFERNVEHELKPTPAVRVVIRKPFEINPGDYTTIRHRAFSKEPEAMYLYGMMLKNGTGVMKNLNEAANYLKNAAEANHADAMYAYGMMLCKGEGIKADYPAGIAYITKAAENGNVDALFEHAKNLYNGQYGVKQSKSEAGKFFKAAADQGHKMAVNKYILMLKSGDGIQRNEVELEYYTQLQAELQKV